MQIAIEKSTSTALYMGELQLSESGLIGEGFIDTRMNPDTCYLIKMFYTPQYTYLDEYGVEQVIPEYSPPVLPGPWRGGAYKLQDGVFVTTPQGDIYLAELEAERLRLKRESAKTERQSTVDAITVTTQAGNTFDGDEVSQGRMARAIIGLQAAGVPTISWTLANNTSVNVTVAELTEALILAGQEQTRLWTLA